MAQSQTTVLCDAFILNICYLQCGFPSQFYLALPQCSKHTGLIESLIGLCEILTWFREYGTVWVAYHGVTVSITCCGLTQRKGKTCLSGWSVFRTQTVCKHLDLASFSLRCSPLSFQVVLELHWIIGILFSIFISFFLLAAVFSICQKLVILHFSFISWFVF